MAEHIYIGSGKERQFDGGGSSINVTLEIDSIEEIFRQYGFLSKSGKRCVRLKLNSRREVGKYRETHSLEVDTWKPDPAQGQPRETRPPERKTSREQDPQEEIPF